MLEIDVVTVKRARPTLRQHKSYDPVPPNYFTATFCTSHVALMTQRTATNLKTAIQFNAHRLPAIDIARPDCTE
jgi:hypothetical protein